mmetsp:Transcript_4903/g.11508  ORF Transcript_4903/g.11508 Transcript_4903/m.11508 type:complete len:204 (-) Transcript_4903:1199-1810(-)
MALTTAPTFLCRWCPSAPFARLHLALPNVALLVLHVELLEHLVSKLRPAASEWVLVDLLLAPLNCLQQGCEELPGPQQLVAAHEALALAADTRQNQAGVCWGAVDALVARGVRKVQFTHGQLEREARLLHIHLHVHCLVWRNTHDKLVSRVLLALEHPHVREGLLELHPHFALAFLQPFAGTDDERHTSPPVVVYPYDQLRKC